jgi:GNAT superfamily N-acetyltransferase
MQSDATFRVASAFEYPHVAAAYEAWGYHGGVSPADTLCIAAHGSDLIAAVRRTHEHGFVLLRGMYVAPKYQRRGIGSQLLDFFVATSIVRHVTVCPMSTYEHSTVARGSRRWLMSLRRLSSVSALPLTASVG